MATPATESRIASAAGGSPAIEVEKLRVRYRRTATDAITGLDLRVCQGQTVALIGTNGAGKSTLLKCLVRLTEPTHGTIRIGGKPVTGASRRAVRQHRRDVGFVFQGFHLIPRLTAFHNVLQGAMGRRGARCAWPWIAPGDVRDEAMACLERVGLGDFADRRVELLSGGQQQRVAIARMLMQRPDVILADEPVASLDPLSANDVLGLLCSIARERDVTVLMTLHQIDLALRYADRVVGMRNGTIEFDELTRHCDIERLTPIFARAAS